MHCSKIIFSPPVSLNLNVYIILVILLAHDLLSTFCQYVLVYVIYHMCNWTRFFRVFKRQFTLRWRTIMSGIETIDVR